MIGGWYFTRLAPCSHVPSAARKTGYQCFVSCNFDSSDSLVPVAMEKKVLEEIMKDEALPQMAALRV
jgi:hypothetical protein